MIHRSDLIDAGRLVKPHGINGEISALLSLPARLGKARCLVLEIDGIFVPFFVRSHRWRGSESVLIHLDGIDNELDAKQLCGKQIYLLRSDSAALPSPASETDETDPDSAPDGFYADDLVGFTMTDAASGSTIGRIADFDDSTENALFIVETPDGRSVYVPVADEFISAIDTDSRTIEVDLPPGLLEVNS